MKVPQWSYLPLALLVPWALMVGMCMIGSALAGDGALDGLRVGSWFWAILTGLGGIGYGVRWSFRRLGASLNALGKRHGPRKESSGRLRLIALGTGIGVAIASAWTPARPAAFFIGIGWWIACEFLLQQYERGRGINPPPPEDSRD